jgi:DNA uptake protein ComE-like DNA-binding protein
MNRLLIATLALAACQGATEIGSNSAAAVSLPPADAQRILDFVNYPGTDDALLNGAVGLDSRAAQNIIKARNGADGVAPSADDHLFTTIAELDAISYVADSAFKKLQSYSAAHPAPAGETVEGVSFAGWESQAVVWGVNQASQADLDALMDSRAAAGLSAKRPFTTVAQMGPVAYVGAAALGKLRAHAGAWWTAMQAAALSCIDAFDDAVGPQLPALLFLSESDRPIDLVSYPGQGKTAPTAASFFKLLSPGSGWSFENRDPNNYYVDLEPSGDGDGTAAAAAVQAAVAAQLTDVIYVAVHKPAGDPYQAEVDVYLIGRTKCGDLVGLHAISVET